MKMMNPTTTKRLRTLAGRVWVAGVTLTLTVEVFEEAKPVVVSVAVMVAEAV
jgi:hypothetical protein